MPDTPLLEIPGHLIRRLSQRSTAIFLERSKAAGYDVTSVQFSALHTIHHNPGIDQATLANKIAYDRATIGGVVARLEAKGFVARRVNAHDRRARNLWLTKDGKNAFVALAPVVSGQQKEVLSPLTDDEYKLFIDLAKKVVAPSE